MGGLNPSCFSGNTREGSAGVHSLKAVFFFTTPLPIYYVVLRAQQ